MERDIEELRQERDLARSQLELERKANKVHEVLGMDYSRFASFPGEKESATVKHTPERREAIGRQSMLKKFLTSSDPSILVSEIWKLERRQLQLCEDANRVLEILHKDFATHKLGNQETTETMWKVLSEIKGMLVASSTSEDIVISDKANLMEEITRLKSHGKTIASLERKLENVQKSIYKLFSSLPSSQETPESKNQLRRKKVLPFTLSNSPNMQHIIICTPSSPLFSSCKAIEHGIENRVPENDIALVGSDAFARLHRDTPQKDDESYNSILSQQGSPATC